MEADRITFLTDGPLVAVLVWILPEGIATLGNTLTDQLVFDRGMRTVHEELVAG